MTAEQWQAIKQRDAAYDGRFYYAVSTTGIVCKPSCPGRRCLPKNVIIFNTLPEALQAGYRPCRRCRPDQAGFKGAQAELATRASNYMAEHLSEPFRLGQIAEALFINKSYLARTYRKITGRTLLETHTRLRMQKACELLTHNEFSITQVSFRVGFTSSAYFCRVFRETIGVSPRAWRTQYLASIDRE